MAATVYLFLLAISIVSGTIFSVNQKGSPSMIRRERSYQPAYSKFFSVNQESLWYDEMIDMDDCLSRHHPAYECYLNLRKARGHQRPIFRINNFKANTRNLLPEILNEGNKQINKPESYINSILDEDKRDTSNFNASENVLNSTWIEIKDPRKNASTAKSGIANAEETGEFVSSIKKNIATGEKANSSSVEEKGNTTNFTAIDGSETDGETTTEIKQQAKTITETRDVVNGGKTVESTTVPEKISDATKEAIRGKTTSKQDSISVGKIDEENKGNTHVQKKTTGIFSSENAEKSTIADLNTDSDKLRFKVTSENATVSEADIEVTTANQVQDNSSSTEQKLLTESRNTLTSVVSEDLNNGTILTKKDFTSSTVFITTLSTDLTKSKSASVSDANISPSNETASATSSSTAIFPSVSVTEPPRYTSKSTDGDISSNMITDSKPSNSGYGTKSIPVVPEHVINIRSIKVAKIVLSVLLLMTGLIAVVMLAVYLFRIRRGAVQYDQLTLLP